MSDLVEILKYNPVRYKALTKAAFSAKRS